MDLQYIYLFWRNDATCKCQRFQHFNQTKGGKTCHDLEAWERNTWSAPISKRFRHLWLEPWKLTGIDLGIYSGWSGELWRNLYGSVFWHVPNAVCCFEIFANGTPKAVWFWQLSGVFCIRHNCHTTWGLLLMSKPSWWSWSWSDGAAFSKGWMVQPFPNFKTMTWRRIVFCQRFLDVLGF